ncbi:SEC-C domain-containing protein [Larsenimonas suaedae]|uniref:SEC-C domain-containing protein n=1 Tax=Larsenimonas suaedae TaxID=1851019 RepID=A0ABU1GX17_9GAMM|nr:SEC-C domain-containing protein [Larsenimonas suaedae]MCM2971164.1 SEC-C domain-containing protein [Larsenimonas suaedae]MDR5895873.1 SEC-C domain-containing protein [Larsenimonas suaedae]
MLANWVDQLLGFATKAQAVIHQDEQYPELTRWARREGATLLGDDVSLAQALTPLLWNQTPLVRCGFACEPLAPPAVDEPCWCDSGKRFDRCCGAVTLPGPVPSHLMWMLSLQEWRGERLRRALLSLKAPTQALLEAAIISVETGQLGRAQRLLEAFFQLDEWEATPETSESAFELLTDVYHERGFTRKKDAFVDDIVDRGPNFLKGAALERVCLAFMDSDDLSGARDAFLKALKLIPDAPSLAYIETMLLLHEGQPQEAGERAGFWARRLKRQAGLDEEYLDFLEQLAHAPADTLAEQMIYSEEELAEPLAMLSTVLMEYPPVEELPLSRNECGTLMYLPTADHTADYTQWRQYFTADDVGEPGKNASSDLWVDALKWLDGLCEHPDWLATPAILQELTMALAVRFGNLPWMMRPFFEPIAKQFELWLGCIEQEQGVFSWEEGDNDIIYQLGLGLIMGMERGDPLRSKALSERLLSLDKQDDLGLREVLLEQHLRQGEDDKALSLVDPLLPEQSDWLGLLVGRALVFYRLGRMDEAQGALSLIHQHNPHMLTLLARANPKREHNEAHSVAPGSRGEAWQYRVLLRGQWLATPGAIDWLKRALKRF